MLKPENVIALVDTREQSPFALHPLRAVVETLSTGDYSIRGLENLVALERKSIPDLLGCIGRERPRFEAELQRLRAYPYRAVVIEGEWRDLTTGNYRAKIAPAAAAGTVAAWCGRYAVPFQFCGDREAAEDFTRRFLFCAARAEWTRLQKFTEEIEK